MRFHYDRTIPRPWLAEEERIHSRLPYDMDVLVMQADEAPHLPCAANGWKLTPKQTQERTRAFHSKAEALIGESQFPFSYIAARYEAFCYKNHLSVPFEKRPVFIFLPAENMSPAEAWSLGTGVPACTFRALDERDRTNLMRFYLRHESRHAINHFTGQESLMVPARQEEASDIGAIEPLHGNDKPPIQAALDLRALSTFYLPIHEDNFDSLSLDAAMRHVSLPFKPHEYKTGVADFIAMRDMLENTARASDAAQHAASHKFTKILAFKASAPSPLAIAHSKTLGLEKIYLDDECPSPVFRLLAHQTLEAAARMAPGLWQGHDRHFVAAPKQTFGHVNLRSYSIS